MMMGTKFDIKKFDEKNDFGLWQVWKKALLEQQGLAAAFEELPAATIVAYDNVIQKKAFCTLIFRDTLKLEDVLATLNSRELKKLTEAKGDGGEGLNEDQVSDSGADGYDNADVMMGMSVKELLDWIMDSGRSYYITYMRDYLVDFKEYDGGNILLGNGRECRERGTGKIKVIKGSLVVLSGTRRANCVYTLDGQVVIRKTLKGRKQLGEYQTGWKIKMEDTTMSTYLVNRSPSSAIRFKTPVDMLGFFGWLASIKQGMLEPVKVVLYRNIVFNESGEYKKTFIGSGVGTSSMQVLQGVEFEVEPHEDHTFEVEPHGNVDYLAAEIWATKGLLDKAKGNVLGMKIGRDPSGNTLRVSQSRFYNRKLEYQVVYKRLDIASADVGMLDKFDHRLQTNVQVFVDFDYTMGRSITIMAGHMKLREAAKEAIGLKGLVIESGFELNIVAGIATGAFSKVIPFPRF
ncbi:hypothetical protein Tco_0000854 [Tanacetum coccineum]